MNRHKNQTTKNTIKYRQSSSNTLYYYLKHSTLCCMSWIKYILTIVGFNGCNRKCKNKNNTLIHVDYLFPVLRKTDRLYLQCNAERVQEVTTCPWFQGSIKNEKILVAEKTIYWPRCFNYYRSKNICDRHIAQQSRTTTTNTIVIMFLLL